MDAEYLKTRLNDYVAEGRRFVPRKAVAIYGEQDWDAVRKALVVWQQSGWLRIVSDPEVTDDNAPCVEMLNFIGNDRPLDAGWLK